MKERRENGEKPWFILAKHFLETCGEIISLKAHGISTVNPNKIFTDYLIRGKAQGKKKTLLIRWMHGALSCDKNMAQEFLLARHSHKAHWAILCSKVKLSPEVILFSNTQAILTVTRANYQKTLSFKQYFALIAKVITVDSWVLELPHPDLARYISDKHFPELYCLDAPIQNWLHRESIPLLRKCHENSLISMRYNLNALIPFYYSKKILFTKTIDVWMSCQIKYIYQINSTPLSKLNSFQKPIKKATNLKVDNSGIWKNMEINSKHNFDIVFFETSIASSLPGIPKLKQFIRSKEILFFNLC